MRVDPQSLLFVDMTPEEAAQVEEVAMAITLQTRSVYPEGEPLWQTWSAAYPVPMGQLLLVFATVFPLRCFASAVRYREVSRA